MTCIFCKSITGFRAKEHVVPQWALDEFDLRNNYVQPTHFSEGGEIVSDRLHTFNAMIAGRVCEQCNNGWMSDLESENRRLITELGHGRRDIFGLHDEAAIGLARWAFKTALVLSAASNYRKIIPEQHYRHMVLDSSTLPTGVHVVGNTLSLPCGFSWVQSPSWLIHQPDRQLVDHEIKRLNSEGYKICLCLSNLLLLVAFNPLPKTRVLMWTYLHVPLFPRRGPFAWMQCDPNLPTDHPMKAVIKFHGTFGIVPV